MVGDTMKQALLQRLTDAGIQDWCGKVLYSGTNTLKPGPVYMLGFNPGGDPAKEPMTLAHLQDCKHEVEQILNPKN